MRALLLNDRAPLPSSAEVDRIWSGLAGGLNIAPVPTAAPQAGQVAVAAAAGKGALAAKLTLAIVLVAGAGASIGWHSLSSHNPREAGPRGKATKMKPSEALPPADRIVVAPLLKPTASPAASAAREIRPRPEKVARARSVALASQPAAPGVAIPAAEELPPSARGQADVALGHSTRDGDSLRFSTSDEAFATVHRAGGGLGMDTATDPPKIKPRNPAGWTQREPAPGEFVARAPERSNKKTSARGSLNSINGLFQRHAARAVPRHGTG